MKYVLALILAVFFINVCTPAMPWAMDDPADDDLFAEYEKGNDLPPVPDPLYWFNYGVYHFNDRLYYWALKPLATGYRAVVPQPVRTGINNFFYNLMFPVRFVNALLQGKGKAAGTEFDIFLINSTAGIIGFSQLAQNTFGLKNQEEDFGQTLGTYRVGEGFYLVLPMLGPSTLRDFFGRAGDYFLKPVSYVEPMEKSLGLYGLDTINQTSFRIGDYELLKSSAVDHYLSMKNAYVQYRRIKVGE
ncbi:MAG: VacJ family lipoprotein [Pseudomonadota bacterium]